MNLQQKALATGNPLQLHISGVYIGERVANAEDFVRAF